MKSLLPVHASLFLALAVFAAPARGELTTEAQNVIGGAQALIREPFAPGEEAAIAEDIARALADDGDKAGKYAAAFASAAELAQSAEHPATRIMMEDFARQLAANLVAPSETSPLVTAFEAKDPMVGGIGPGAGLSKRDVVSVVLLETLAEDVPETIGDPQIERETALSVTKRLTDMFTAESPANRQFLTHIDAWTVGTIEAWPNLTPEERKFAVEITFEPDMPTEELTRKVTGRSDLRAWIAGIDIALTDAERAAHPELVAMLDAGELGGGMTEALAQVNALAAGGVGLATNMIEFNTLQMMTDYNYELLFSP